eukprot:g52679.t1
MVLFRVIKPNRSNLIEVDTFFSEAVRVVLRLADDLVSCEVTLAAMKCPSSPSAWPYAFLSFLCILPAVLAATTITTNTTAAAAAAAWEKSVIAAWTTEADCSPATGMCAACGLGATVVEMQQDGALAVRTYTASYGGGLAPWGPDNTFEIASVTKPFTALLAIMLEKEGVVSMEKTMIGDLLPCAWNTSASPQVSTITLAELAAHTSGLPAQPPNRGKPVEGNPFYKYTQAMLCDSLLKLNGLPARGRYSYSNYAYGTLGYALSLAVAPDGSVSFEDLVRAKITKPLGMNSTAITYDDAGWALAAKGCARGTSRGSETIRRGAYGVLQGNGALRSTLNDMGKFLSEQLRIDHGGAKAASAATPAALAQAMEQAHSIVADACSCVSDWCEGILCQLPNPFHEKISIGGIEYYTSGSIPGWRKSGDTGGYSLRVAWSGEKGRAALAVDTCGGCGGRGTSGSSAQRLALLLADGPPTDGAAVAPTAGVTVRNEASKTSAFAGDAESHIYPSVTQLEVQLQSASVAIASSDGAGALHRRLPRAGTCYQAKSDPLTSVSQKRSLTVVKGESALLQDMGADIYLGGQDSGKPGKSKSKSKGKGQDSGKPGKSDSKSKSKGKGNKSKQGKRP